MAKYSFELSQKIAILLLVPYVVCIATAMVMLYPHDECYPNEQVEAVYSVNVNETDIRHIRANESRIVTIKHVCISNLHGQLCVGATATVGLGKETKPNILLQKYSLSY